jgi:Ca2+-binding EF-hand superfamily protein
LSKQYRRELLEREGFVASKLDLDKKGYILIEDLVRFLNIESGTFLRNRDLSIIFRRINKKSEKVMFEDILSAICP